MSLCLEPCKFASNQPAAQPTAPAAVRTMATAPATTQTMAMSPLEQGGGSFPTEHYSAGKLYTHFCLSDGENAPSWRKTRVFQAEDKPQAYHKQGRARMPAHAEAAQRDQQQANSLATLSILTSMPADELFRVSVPASRFLHRLVNSVNLPPIMRKRPRELLQSRLLALVDPPPSLDEAAFKELTQRALEGADLSDEENMNRVTKRLCRLAAARQVAAAASAARPQYVGRQVGRGRSRPGRGGTSGRAQSRVPKGGDVGQAVVAMAPITGGVSKTSGRTLFVPARLREPAYEPNARRYMGGAKRQGLAHRLYARKATRGDEEPERQAAEDQGPLLGTGGHSPNAMLTEMKQAVRVGDAYQAILPSDDVSDARLAYSQAQRLPDRGDTIVWAPPTGRPAAASRGASTRSGRCEGQPATAPQRAKAAQAVDDFLDRLGPGPAGGARGKAALVEEGLAQLFACDYDVEKALEAMRQKQTQPVASWSKVGPAPPARPWPVRLPRD